MNWMRCLVWFLIGGLLACSPQKPSFQAIDLTGADYAQGFDLPDQEGQRRTLADFKGKVVVVFLATPNAPIFAPPPSLNGWM